MPIGFNGTLLETLRFASERKEQSHTKTNFVWTSFLIIPIPLNMNMSINYNFEYNVGTVIFL
jgi:hypothetical protein